MSQMVFLQNDKQANREESKYSVIFIESRYLIGITRRSLHLDLAGQSIDIDLLAGVDGQRISLFIFL